jgi:hypothetical protein
LQTQSTHKFQNKEKHIDSKTFGLWVGQKKIFIKNKCQQEIEPLFSFYVIFLAS